MAARRNPILWRERLRQQRQQPRHKWLWRVATVAVYVGIFGAIVYSLTDMESPSRELAVHAVWAVYVVAVIRCIVIGVNVMSQEHTNQTWDVLTLTGVPLRNVFFGKWIAALNRAAPWLLALGAARLIMIPVSMYALMNRYAPEAAMAIIRYGASGNTYYDPDYLRWMLQNEWVGWAAVVAVFSSVALSVLDLFGCTMLGMASAALVRKGIAANIAALTIRFIPVVVGFLSVYADPMTQENIQTNSPALFQEAFTLSGTAVADGGSAPISRLALPLMRVTVIAETHVRALEGLGMAYLMTAIVLLTATVCLLIALRASGVLFRRIPTKLSVHLRAVVPRTNANASSA